tara:strand:+ start:506 stop:709 length:204 start_codon:yes stop_codon:yes gene_type:complete
MIISTSQKCADAIRILKTSAEFRFTGLIESEEDFNKIEWKQSDDSFSTTNPHAELNWTAVKTEMDKL